MLYHKITINRPIWIFSAIIELLLELVISNMHNKFEQDTWTTFEFIAPRAQGQIIPKWNEMNGFYCTFVHI